MRVEHLTGVSLESMLDLQGALWRQAASSALQMSGTPVGMQPTEAVRNSWQNRSVGAIKRVNVQAVHNGSQIAFRLGWNDAELNLDHGDNSRFPDAAAIAFPFTKDSPLVTMGAPNAPLGIWYWRADSDGSGFQVKASGPGTTQIVDRQMVRTSSRWQDGRWDVVIVRQLESIGADTIKLMAGLATRFGVAVWEGGHGERGGLKASCGDWQALNIAGKP